VFLPRVTEEESIDDPLYIGFFHTGAYQESLGGYGGIQHCLIPAPKHVIINKDENGDLSTYIFGKEQSYKSMLKTLGYF
jgi:arginine decarboxylase